MTARPFMHRILAVGERESPDVPRRVAVTAIAVTVAVSLGCTKPDVPAPDGTSPEASSTPQAGANAFRRFLAIATQASPADRPNRIY